MDSVGCFRWWVRSVRRRTFDGGAIRAALIMVTTFIAFGLADVVLIKSIGIAIDATIVRALIVPAIMRLLGTRNWLAPRSIAGRRRGSGFGELAPEAGPA